MTSRQNNPLVPDFVVAVGAGRFDATTTAITARAERSMKLASLYLTTELMRDQLHAFHVDGKKTLHLSEFGLMYDPAEWRVVKAPRLAWLTKTVTFNRGSIRIRPRGLTVLLEHLPTGRQGWFDMHHLPAHIQAGGEFTDLPHAADEVLAHKRATKHAGERSRRRRKSHPERFQFWAGDVNLNQLVPVWREYMANRLHLLGVYRAPYPVMGDLGARLITSAWTTPDVRGIGAVVPRVPAEESLDHRLTLVSCRFLHTL